MLPAGEMNQRITFQSKVSTRNDHGDQIETWNNGETVWAKVIPATGTERFRSDQLKSETDVVFQIRYLATVTPIRRLTWGGVQYEILSVFPMEGRKFDMEIQARSGVKHA